jgi:hypothetical protein
VKRRLATTICTLTPCISSVISPGTGRPARNVERQWNGPLTGMAREENLLYLDLPCEETLPGSDSASFGIQRELSCGTCSSRTDSIFDGRKERVGVSDG